MLKGRLKKNPPLALPLVLSLFGFAAGCQMGTPGPLRPSTPDSRPPQVVLFVGPATLQIGDTAPVYLKVAAGDAGLKEITFILSAAGGIGPLYSDSIPVPPGEARGSRVRSS